MLTNLYIKNFALFDELSVDFDDGLNIISGETGSGKSILINAIALLLGGRINKSFIGNFAKETIVEASFSIDQKLKNTLLELEFDWVIEDDNLIISRRFSNNSSNIKLNNRSINLSRLEDLSSSVMDIHGQHSQLIVLNKSNYIRLIDSFNDQTIDLKEKLKANINKLQELTDKLSSIDLDEDQILRELDILQFQVEEIEAFNFDNFHEEELNKEYKKLSNLTEILSGLAFVKEIFSEGYHNSSLKDYINEIYVKLLDISEFDDKIEEFTSRLIDIRELTNELSRDIETYSYSIDIDEERLQEIDTIFNTIHKLKRKYGPEIEDILSYLDNSKKRLEELRNIDDLRSAIKHDIDKINQDSKKIADNLTLIRKSVIEKLEKHMVEELSQMNMKNIEFKIDLSTKESISDLGQDSIDFLISTNKGQGLRSLNSVASGGEISRFMLALKAVLADKEEVQTIIFDEIDTGISGKTADIVGDKLVNISKKRQLLVITHLPQIASKADHHYLIEKTIQGNTTKSYLSKLENEGKVKEVARLISGSNITESTMNSALELIKNAKR